MKLSEILSSALLCSTLARADIEFIFPTAGSTARGGDVVTAFWKDSGNHPKISELTNYTLSLCAGQSTVASTEDLAVLVNDGSFARGNSVSFHIDPGVGPDSENAYFLKMISRGPSSYVVNYSKRFSLSAMTGNFPEAIQRDLESINTEEISEELERRQEAVAASLFTIPYQDQLTGLTKYAPMAKQPASTIHAGNPTPQFPTSAYIVATTYLAEPTVQTTITESQIFSVSSIENPASAAPKPQEDMKKYLKRWED